MQSPHAEWPALIGALAFVDYLRARGEADGDTASEVLRDTFARHPQGRHLFTLTWAAFAFWFWRHITRGMP